MHNLQEIARIIQASVYHDTCKEALKPLENTPSHTGMAQWFQGVFQICLKNDQLSLALCQT